MNESKYEMPIGFSLSLGVNQKALDYFSTLDLDTKLKIKEYIQNSSTSDEALEKTNIAINSLNNNNISFLP